MSNAANAGFFSRLRRVLRSGFAELEADDLRDASRRVGGTPIAECRVGDQVTVGGRIRSVTLCPNAVVPEVEAELYDGSGKVRLVWLGRRRIRGVSPGREILATGRLAESDGVKTIYNPAYDLSPASGGG